MNYNNIDNLNKYINQQVGFNELKWLHGAKEIKMAYKVIHQLKNTLFLVLTDN